MTNKKLLVAGIGGMIVTGLVVAVAMLFVFNKSLRYETQAEMLAAVPKTAQAELDTRGHKLAQPLACHTMEQATEKQMLVNCEATTADRKRVQVFGAALAASQDEYYTILVGGKPIVKNAHCLGADCKD
ncbi:hypothetical protein [Actinocorallia longicatena]|uniref:DUF4333 domain-containing protein n=1 Tax=Actinocorallia longicatena TaxID=111803 RepID=A0ABP6Q2I6_9ACTN